METFDYRESRRYAMKLGLWGAGMWISSFLIVVYTMPSLVTEIGYLIGLCSIGLVGWAVRKYREQMPGMTVLRCWWMTWFTFMCTVLLTSASQFVYFAYMDGGRFFGGIHAMLSSQEVTNAYEQAQAGDLLLQIKEAISQMETLSTRDITMSLTTSNLVMGFFFSLLALLFLIGGKKKTA